MSTIATAPASLRLTRRGRVVIFAAAVLLAMAVAVLLGTTSVATSNTGGAAQPTELIMVDAGETLWDIASDLADDGQVRDMMNTIKKLNALDSSMLLAGQELHVPVH